MAARIELGRERRVTAFITSISDGESAFPARQSGHHLRLRHRDAAPASQFRMPGFREWSGEFKRYASAAI